MRRPLARALTVAYGACALAVFSLMLLVATILALLLPRLEWRRVVTRTLARLGLPLLGIRLSIHGRELLPPGSCVVVANHASYLDGVVMKAALPPRFSFVIKGEAAAMPVAGFLLKRIGSEFVERGSHAGRQRGAMRVLRRAEEGHALVFFPEGTFDEVVGLKRFHIGAFAAAVRGSMPVVPVVIRGTRRALPSGALIVRPGRVRLDILEALPVPQSPHPSEALRAAARARILARLDEPDLAPAEPPRA